MDILITTFELVFGVVQKVWPGIQDTISGVWSHLEPIFDTIGKGADLLAGAWSKVKDLVTGGGDTGSGSSGGGASPGRMPEETITGEAVPPGWVRRALS